MSVTTEAPAAASSQETEPAVPSSIVPPGRYWGAETQRALEAEPIAHHRLQRPMIHAFGVVKKACALTNLSNGTLGREKAELIVRASDELIAGLLDDHFPLVIWQDGSAARSNVNANEVIANRANELAGGALGSWQPIHPVDDVDAGLPAADVFPIAMHVAATLEIRARLGPALTQLRRALESKGTAVGGGHPPTEREQATVVAAIGEDLASHSAHLVVLERGLVECLHALEGVPLRRANAVAPPGWVDAFAATLARSTGVPFGVADVGEDGASDQPIVATSRVLRTLALACFDVATDVRIVASRARHDEAPRTASTPRYEALKMVAAQVLGNDTVIGFAASRARAHVNVFKPVMIYNLLESMDLLADALTAFTKHCVLGIESSARRSTNGNLEAALVQVAALAPLIGHYAAAKVATTAFLERITLREAALALGLVTGDEFDARM
jgi:fumarate hydratase class II